MLLSLSGALAVRMQFEPRNGDHISLTATELAKIEAGVKVATFKQ